MFKNNSSNTKSLHNWYELFRDRRLSEINSQSVLYEEDLKMLEYRMRLVSFWLSKQLYTTHEGVRLDLMYDFQEDLSIILSLDGLTQDFTQKMLAIYRNVVMYYERTKDIPHVSYRVAVDAEGYMSEEEISSRLYDLDYLVNPEIMDIFSAYLSEDLENLSALYTHILFCTDITDEYRDDYIYNYLNVIQKLEYLEYKCI